MKSIVMREHLNSKRDKTPYITLWFKLTRNQQRKLTELGQECLFLYECPVEVFKRVTKNKTLIESLCKMKRDSIRLVA